MASTSMKPVLAVLLVAASLLLAPPARSDVVGSPSGLTEMPDLPPVADQKRSDGVGGIVSAMPAYAEYPNQLVNPGFESGATGWTLGAGFSIDTAVSRSGGASLRVDIAPGVGYVRQLNFRRGQNCFAIRGWMKIGGTLGRTTSTYAAAAKLGVYDITHGGTAEASLGSPETLGAWTRFELKNQNSTPGHINDLMEFRVYLTNAASGTVWFDDLEFVPAAPPVRSFIKYPNYRGYLWNDKGQVITGNVEVNPPPGLTLNDVTANITLLNAETSALLETKTVNPGQTITDFWFDVRSTIGTTGEYTVRTELVRKSDGALLASYCDYRIVRKSAADRDAMDVWFDEDQRLHIGGAIRFPWGVYDRVSSWRIAPGGTSVGLATGTTPQTFENSLKGFGGQPSTLASYQDTKSNTVLYFSPFSGANPGYSTPDKDQINAWTNALRNRGAMHLQIVNNYYDGNAYKPAWGSALPESELWRIIGQNLTDPAFLGYYTADEPDLKNEDVDKYARQYLGLRASNPDHPTYTVMYRPGTTSYFREISDVIGSDPYPVGAGMLPDDVINADLTYPRLGRVDYYTREVRTATAESRPVWMVLQLYTLNGKFPTYDEMRKMAWKAVVNGANGILWWGFVSSVGIEGMEKAVADGTCVAPACSATAYADFRRISTEVMALESVLIEKTLAGVFTCNSADVSMNVKYLGGKYYVFTTNLKNSGLASATFTFGGSGVASVEVYGESRSVAPSGATWTDAYTGHDAHVYVVTPR